MSLIRVCPECKKSRHPDAYYTAKSPLCLWCTKDAVLKISRGDRSQRKKLRPVEGWEYCQKCGASCYPNPGEVVTFCAACGHDEPHG